MNIAEIARQLQQIGYVVLPHPLRPGLSAALRARCQDDGDLRFRPARIGRDSALRHDALRGDAISWLDAGDAVDDSYLQWMEGLRSGLNAALYLGLFDYECHYAIYAPGAAYAKHSDVLHGARPRILSTVLYLNDAWQAGDGGELVLFEPTGDAVLARVIPTFGTMILFLSDGFPHAVLAAHATRRSIAGWFRGRDGG